MKSNIFWDWNSSCSHTTTSKCLMKVVHMCGGFTGRLRCRWCHCLCRPWAKSSVSMNWSKIGSISRVPAKIFWDWNSSCSHPTTSKCLMKVVHMCGGFIRRLTCRGCPHLCKPWAKSSWRQQMECIRWSWVMPRPLPNGNILREPEDNPKSTQKFYIRLCCPLQIVLA